VPIWDEIEQMLDSPYAIRLDTTVGGNYQGWPSYRSTLERRRSFIYRNAAGQPCAPLSSGCNEVPLEGHVVHPLNYNHMNGEELRLLNITFDEIEWEIPDQIELFEESNTNANGLTDRGCPTPDRPCPLGVPVYRWSYKTILVSAGRDRMEDDETSPDHNSPIKPDDRNVCIVTSEAALTVPEGSITCGGDPGEPGYAGFGFLRGAEGRESQYSTPALVLSDVAASQRNPAWDITQGLGVGTRRLFDPAGCEARNDQAPGSCEAPGYINRLLKPTLRATPGSAPDYLFNSDEELIKEANRHGRNLPPSMAQLFLKASNENDYYRGNARADKVAARNVAAALGKALFWDMQVGSDGVQSCGTCHFHAGVDHRTKNQLNPNTLGGDNTLQLHGGVPNRDLTLTDFPFHKLTDVTVSGERASDGPGIIDNNPGNVVRHTNDVASSMGVIFSEFTDIPAPGAGTGSTAFVQTTAPRPVAPDVRATGARLIDPVPLFQGLRRVEPRNTPIFFAAAMNFDNFWDGRARHDFNGGSVFGPSDPQAHVMVDDGGKIVATRQIIRFSSLASLATGPALSDFEMSFAGRNWPKIGKKLLQNGVTPLANQLVDPMDSVLGPYSNQPGNPAPNCAAGAVRAAGKPGLCRGYDFFIRQAFYPALHRNTGQRLVGCYTDGKLDIHPNQCAAGTVAIPMLVSQNGTDTLVNSPADPFDNYVLRVVDGQANARNSNEFTQMEANMALFFGLSLQAWVNMLVPDDTPMDRFYDANPDAFISFGEANERFLVPDMLNCGQLNPITGQIQTNNCFTEVGNFKRDAQGLVATLNCITENCDNPEARIVPVSGTRRPGDPDPLLGMDFFLGSNISLRNPNFRSLRCGECHQGGTLTDHTIEVSHQWSFNDWVQEFGTPGNEIFPEPLGRNRIISGFSLEGEIGESAQDAIERNVADFCTVEPCVDAFGNEVPGGRLGGFPQGQALFDNGVYNIGVTPIPNDTSRGGKDAFGWPLSLSYLALKNLCGIDYTPGGDNPNDGFAQPRGPNGQGIPCPRFDPDPESINPFTGEEGDPTGGGLYERTAQDQQINPGFVEEPIDPQLPPYLAKWASNLVVGDEVNQDELFVGVNTLNREPIKEGFVDTFGPFNPAATIGENFNSARQPEMATWPNVNRVNAQGSFKAPPLRNIALTGPYFHNGGNVTLRQQLDFYLRGGDFPKSNAHHRDFLIMNLREEDEALGGVDPISGQTLFTGAEKETIIRAVIDFLLELTDERVAFERAPFDHPEIFVPLDGRAPDNTFGRTGLLARTTGNCANVAGAGPCFLRVPEVGMGGRSQPLENFLGVTNIRPNQAGYNCNPAAGPVSHYCSKLEAAQ
jgi:cytochrome c peroxidase